MENYNKQEIEKITKELFSLCFEKGLYFSLSKDATMVSVRVYEFLYFSFLTELIFKEKSALVSKTETLPIWELLEIVKNYKNEE